MIEVSITSHGGQYELASIRIENVETHDDGTADYVVQFASNRGGEQLGLHRRSIRSFPRDKYNALALLLQALNTLEPEELELDGEIRSPDMARRQYKPLREIQAWADRLRSD